LLGRPELEALVLPLPLDDWLVLPLPLVWLLLPALAWLLLPVPPPPLPFPPLPRRHRRRCCARFSSWGCPDDEQLRKHSCDLVLCPGRGNCPLPEPVTCEQA